MVNSLETPKEMFNILSHQGSANQKPPWRFHLTPVRMAKIKNSGDSRCWQVCGERGALLHCWWDCKLVRQLWKTVWWFLRKLDIVLLSFFRRLFSWKLNPWLNGFACPFPFCILNTLPDLYQPVAIIPLNFLSMRWISFICFLLGFSFWLWHHLCFFLGVAVCCS